MATIKGFQSNEVKPQPGFEPSQNENGGWEGTHTFAMTRASFENTAVRQRFRKGVPVTSLDQSVPSFFSFMKLARTKVTFGVGDIIYVQAVFAGGEYAQYGGGDEGLSGSAQPTYELNGALSEQPLSNHWKWAALGEDDKIALGFLIRGASYDRVSFKVGSFVEQANGPPKFTPYQSLTGEEVEVESADAKEFAALISSGITTYLSPTTTWTERTEGNASMTNAQLNVLGNISTPRGSPPTPNGGRNWMLTSAHQSETGGKYLTIIEWTLSEREGWGDFLYED